jgi:hypothetical protein
VLDYIEANLQGDRDGKSIVACSIPAASQRTPHALLPYHEAVYFILPIGRRTAGLCSNDSGSNRSSGDQNFALANSVSSVPAAAVIRVYRYRRR